MVSRSYWPVAIVSVTLVLCAAVAATVGLSLNADARVNAQPQLPSLPMLGNGNSAPNFLNTFVGGNHPAPAFLPPAAAAMPHPTQGSMPVPAPTTRTPTGIPQLPALPTMNAGGTNAAGSMTTSGGQNCTSGCGDGTCTSNETGEPTAVREGMTLCAKDCSQGKGGSIKGSCGDGICQRPQFKGDYWESNVRSCDPAGLYVCGAIHYCPQDCGNNNTNR